MEAPARKGKPRPRRALDGAAGATATSAQEISPTTEQNGTADAAPAPNGDAVPKKTDRRASLIERITRAEKPVA